jgi:hypothetical protein
VVSAANCGRNFGFVDRNKKYVNIKSTPISVVHSYSSEELAILFIYLYCRRMHPVAHVT